MMSAFRHVSTACLVALCAPLALAAQEVRPAVDSLIVEHRYDGTHPDTVRVFLETNRVYRVELLGRSTTLTVRPVIKHRSDAFLSHLPQQGQPGSTFEMYPIDRGAHTVTVDGLAPGDTAVVRLLTDVAGTMAEADRRRARLGSRWAIDLIGGAGRHDAFAVAPSTLIGGGLEAEGGLHFSSFRFPVSLYGGASYSHPAGTGPSVTWFFLEPRVRLRRFAATELGLLARVSQGNVEGTATNPTYYGAGLWAIQRLSGRTGGSGFGLAASAMTGRLGGVKVQREALTRLTLGLVARL
jgi:hypothetical protein